MSEVAIIGIGMHPFGRHDGVTGMEQGAVAVRAACKDAGLEWSASSTIVFTSISCRIFDILFDRTRIPWTMRHYASCSRGMPSQEQGTQNA